MDLSGLPADCGDRLGRLLDLAPAGGYPWDGAYPSVSP